MVGDRQPLAQDLRRIGEAPDLVPGAASGADAARYRSREWNSDHPVNLRLSIPLIFFRCYITLVAGKERRSAKRFVAERRKHPLATAGNMAVLFALGTLCGLAGLGLVQLASAYILKETGIMVVPQ